MTATNIQVLSERVAAVFCVGALSNSYAIATDDGAYLVDSGVDATGRSMLEGLRAVDRNVEDLNAIYITHWHNDHSAGAAALRKSSGARVWYPEGEREHFEQEAVGGLRAWLSARTPEHGPLGIIKGLVGSSPPRAVEADCFPSNRAELPHGVIALHTPGHTRDHFSYWDPQLRALFAGDALAVCGGKLSFMSRFLTADLPTALSTTRSLMDFDAAVICPGHRAALTEDVEAERARMRDFLDEGGSWPWWS
jgi:glyoxylase-like metal-dependent hydrolase (beta-lactamase superfamily II)